MKPEFNDQDFSKPSKALAPDGEYRMAIVFEPFLNASQAGNDYISLTMVHADEESRALYKQVKSVVVLSKATPETKLFTLTGLLQSLGYSKEDIHTFEYEKDEETSKAILTINGEPLLLEGKEVTCQLVTKEWNGVTRNEVKRFVA